jgi:hypothetical protein
LWERVDRRRASGGETGEGSLTLVVRLPLIRHGLRPRHLLPQGEKGKVCPDRMDR